jgi:hypothetical protein
MEGGALVLADPKAAQESMKAFQQLKENLLRDEDLQKIAGKTYIKRSGWRKIALGFNISTAVLDVRKERTSETDWLVEVKARATAPNGRFSEEVGACETSEMKTLGATVHNLETKATTRAINRAISNLVGGGVVTAEEMEATQTADSQSGKEGAGGELRTATSGTDERGQADSGKHPAESDTLEAKLLRLPWKVAQSGKSEYVFHDEVKLEVAEEIGKIFDPKQHEWRTEKWHFVVKDNGSLLRFKRRN